jgi:predicted permease
VLFAFGVSVVVGIMFGTAPALQAWRVDLNTVLKGAGEGAARMRSFSLGKALVVAQVALSLPLLVVAGLFVHSFQKLARVGLGYDQDHLLLLQADTVGYKGAGVGQFYRELSERIRVLPGVSGVTLSANGLFTGRETSYRIAIEGYLPPPGQNMSPSFDHVGADYFPTVGLPVMRGRAIGPEDAGSGQRVGLINQTMAHDYFGDTDPLGRNITVNVSTAPNVSTPYPFVVIGVVADAKHYTVREKARPLYYLPLDNPIGVANEGYLGTPICIIRTTGDPAALIAAVRTVVKEATPNSSWSFITTVSQQIEGTLALDRALTGFSGFFGALATILVSIGIYGIMAYAVARRTREIGIRIAIGARSGNVLSLILGESLFLMLCGAAIGIPAAIGAGRFVTAFLFGLTPADPLVLATAVVLMFLVGALAAYFPARSATRVNPMVALRSE